MTWLFDIGVEKWFAQMRIVAYLPTFVGLVAIRPQEVMDVVLCNSMVYLLERNRRAFNN